MPPLASNPAPPVPLGAARALGHGRRGNNQFRCALDFELITRRTYVMEKTRTLANLTQSARAFQESRVLLTALELDVFTTLGEGATAAEVSGGWARIRAPLRCCSMPWWRSAPPQARFRVPLHGGVQGAGAGTDGPHAYGPPLGYLVHPHRMRESGGAVRRKVPRASPKPAPAHSSPRCTRGLANAQVTVRLSGVRDAKRMLEWARAGAFSIAFAQACPELRADILDLAAVVPLAEDYIRDGRPSEPCPRSARRYATAEFGEGFDLVLLSAVCHMFGEDENRSLIQRCARAV